MTEPNATPDAEPNATPGAGPKAAPGVGPNAPGGSGRSAAAGARQGAREGTPARPGWAAEPEDRALSPYTGWTRRHWERAADDLLAAVRRFVGPGGALFGLPGPASGSGPYSDAFEGYARTFLLAAFRAAHAEPADAQRLLDVYADGLVTGTDPAAAERWPDVTEVPQARVEAASVALALHETRPLLWDRLPDRARQRAVDWLSRMAGIEVPRNNWLWFRAVVAAFLRSVGAPYAARDIEQAVEATDGWYRGEGWYTDGDGANYDHYNGWAMHLYPLWYCRISGEAAEEGLLARYRARLRAFLADAPYLVAANGSPLFHGRSLTYRFAAASPFFNGALFDATPLPPGRTRRAASGMLRHFLDRGATEEGGVLSLGWHRRFEPMRQEYSGPGSPYWASKGFTGLLLPPDHPVWTAREEPLPVDEGDFTRTLAVPRWLVSGTSADGVVRVVTHGTPHVPHYPHVYTHHAYTTHTAPDMGAGPGKPEGEGRAPGSGGQETGGAAPATHVASAVRGPWEVRLVRADGPVRVAGHPLAGEQPPEVPTGNEGVVRRRSDGLTSALVPLLPVPSATVSLRRAEHANAFGPHSATPVYAAGAGGPHALAVFLGVTEDGTLPAPPRFEADTATVVWPDGTTGTVGAGGPAGG
ncbi:DUF2264 domain-containing protein [Streptomyces hoynatensis]|uniref:DUF2264 domain-containing protein n=1 Tax=Streptomyces hoynatensis TaxID=1141874 RepID=A0A3A9Z0U0_9ACTN|nr:DUF2264 domain-containing protein [Streptomyces hoynatensis]RKN41659.1 DUF2264 domain-containing protein [Streptomyces hoynatensis]